MPYPMPEELWSKMESCVEQVVADGKPKQAAIAICYSSIMDKKVLVSPYPIADKAVGDLVQPGTSEPLTWAEVGSLAQTGDKWAQRMLERRQNGLKVYCSAADCEDIATQLIVVHNEQLPYCAEHLVGAKEVLVRHKLTVDHIKQLEVLEFEPERITAIIALKVPEHISQVIAVPDGQLPETHHVTLVFLGKINALDEEATCTAVQGIASALQPFTAKLDGVTRFEEGAIALNVNSPYLPELRQQIVETLRNLGYSIEDIHGFTPHLTVAYVDSDAPIPDVVLPEDDVEFSELWLFWGDEQHSFPLLATGEKSGFITTEEEQVVFIGGPGDGSGSSIVTSQLTSEDAPAELSIITNEKDDVTADSPPILSSDAKDLDALAATIADRAGDKVDAATVRRDLLEPWLTSVYGTPASDQLQKVAARTFGFWEPERLKELDINWKLLYPMGELYNITQEYLKERGFSEQETVPVYHPYMPTDARPKQWQKDDEVRIKLLPLTSWTLDIREAAKVAEFLGAPGSPVFVLKTFIPIKSVVSTPNTGIGIPGTQEVVLAGGEYEALIEQRYG